MASGMTWASSVSNPRLMKSGLRVPPIRTVRAVIVENRSGVGASSAAWIRCSPRLASSSGSIVAHRRERTASRNTARMYQSGITLLRVAARTAPAIDEVNFKPSREPVGERPVACGARKHPAPEDQSRPRPDRAIADPRTVRGRHRVHASVAVCDDGHAASERSGCPCASASS